MTIHSLPYTLTLHGANVDLRECCPSSPALSTPTCGSLASQVEVFPALTPKTPFKTGDAKIEIWDYVCAKHVLNHCAVDPPAETFSMNDDRKELKCTVSASHAGTTCIMTET